jgi:hypothetical protein
VKQTSVGKIAIATTAFACATLLSFGWSGERGVSLSIESAQARVGHPATATSAAGVSRRHYRRAAYGHGGGVVGAGVAAGAGLAAGAVGTAVAAATAPFGYYGGGPYAGPYPGPYTDGGYYASSPWGDYACSPSALGCKPYASKDWYKH